MFDLKNKYSINAKTSQQNFTIKSILKPDLSKLNLVSNQIIWFRQPPPPYEIEELSFNLNKILYKCSSLDYQCSIICKVISEQTGQLVDRFDYGPIETFLFNRSSPINEFRVNLVLFGQYKKCIFAFNPTPTLINPINNNKYTLTQQDLRSIYFLNQQENTDMQEQSQNPDSNRYSTSSASDNTKFITNKHKKTIIVGNLFQRLILLKLFHEIPNGMYCHSTELLQIIFYDQTSCNMALMALNRFKYQKKQPSQISKSMFNTLQQSAVTKIMKKSNDSFTNLNSIKNSQHHSKSSADQSFHSSKKEFLPLAMLKSLKKSPKESINSIHQSLASKNSNRLNQSKILPDGQQSRLNTSLLQNESKETLRYPESCSRLSIKHPKISILSTDINSTKQTRQQKVSFPQTPNTQHLKSSELIIKPNEFKSCLSLRRSQQEIKTPRMDADDSVNLSSIKGPIKKKSISLIEDPDETQEEYKYVNQFQNLLFQVDESQTKEEQLCLNDSFAKLEQQEQKQKSKYYQSAQKAQIQVQIGNFQIVNHTSPLIDTEFQHQESQPSIHSLKQTLQSVLNENSQLKRKNQELRKQIDEIVQVGGKRNQILKYQKQIQRMKEIKKSLIKEIESLKISACSIKSQSSQKHLHLAVFSPQRIEYKHHNYQTQTKNIIDHFGSIQKKKITATQHKSSISPPRHSKHGNQPYFKYTQPPSPTFAGRRSHQHGCPSFILKQGEPEAINKNTNTPMNSGELKFFRLQNDQGYMKFRTNQSYSYKTTQTFKFEEKRTDKTNNYKSSN